jgi:hypothetical protein
MVEYTFKNSKDGYVTDEQGFTNEVANFLIQYYNIPTDNLPKDASGNIHIPCYSSESPEIAKLILDSRSQIEVTHPLYESIEPMTDEEYITFQDMVFLKSTFDLDLKGLFVTFGEGMEHPLIYGGELSCGFYCHVNNITSYDGLPTRIRSFYIRLGKEALKKGLNLKESVSGKLDIDVLDLTTTPGLLKYTLICYENFRHGMYSEYEDDENGNESEYKRYIGELTGIVCANSAKEDKELFTSSFDYIEEHYINPAQNALNASLDTHLPKEGRMDDNLTKELTLAIISDATKRFENI